VKPFTRRSSAGRSAELPGAGGMSASLSAP
jgi:hypothetical protein